MFRLVFQYIQGIYLLKLRGRNFNYNLISGWFRELIILCNWSRVDMLRASQPPAYIRAVSRYCPEVSWVEARYNNFYTNTAKLFNLFIYFII